MAERDKLNRKQKRDRRRKIPWTIFAALVYASFYIPVLVMILFSFNDAKRRSDLSLRVARAKTSSTFAQSANTSRRP